MAGDWLADAVVYEIYPQSFADSNGDGDRRPPRGDRPPRPHRVARRRRHLVQPVLRLAVRRRRVRRLRLPAHRAALRHQRRPGRAGRAGPGSAASGSCSTWWPGTPRSSTPGSSASCRRRPGPGRRPLRLVRGAAALRRGTPTLPGTPAWVPSPGPRPGWYLKNFYDEQPALNFGWVRDAGRRAVARRRRRPGPAAQPGGAAGDHGLLAEPGGRRVPGRHGVLPGQGRTTA